MKEKKRGSGKQYYLLMRTVKALNVAAITAIFALSWFWEYSGFLKYPTNSLGFWAVIGLYMILYISIGRVYDAFYLSMTRITQMVYSQTLDLIVTNGLCFVVFWIAGMAFPPVWPMVLAMVLQEGIVVLWCYGANRWYFKTYRAKQCVVIKGLREGVEGLIREYDLSRKFDVKASVTVEQCMKNMEMLRDIDTVFLCGVRSSDRNTILKYCVENSIQCYVIPEAGDVIMSSARMVHLFHLPMLCVKRFYPRIHYQIFKRLFDILISGAALIILSPVMLVTAVIIKHTDHGPVLYKQTRLTKDRREFEILKFRSMRVDAEKDGVARLSSGENDPRITPVGRVIRATRIDELPQLINILKGEMTIVGPRPERPEIAEQYEKELPEFSMRLQVKAGLTGYAQVYGKYNSTPGDKLQMDLMYIANASLAEDLKIMFATVKVLFMKDSTEGIAEGQTTAAGK